MIFVILFFYFVSLVISYNYVEEYVYDKFIKAELEIRDKLHDLFKETG